MLVELSTSHSLTLAILSHQYVNLGRKRDGEADLEKAGSAYHALVGLETSGESLTLTTRIIVAYLLNYL
jgi:hypothetical protein